MDHAQTVADFPRDFGQRGALGQALPAVYVQREIAIAEAEPCLHAEILRGVHEMPALVAPPPAGIGVRLSGQGIDERVHVRRDVKAKVFEVVSRVDDKGDLVRLENLRETERELGAADAAGKREHPHGATFGGIIGTGLRSRVG